MAEAAMIGVPKTFEALAEGVCLCGSTVVLGCTDERTICVLHALPTCRDYESRTPQEYLLWFSELDARTLPDASAKAPKEG